MTKPRPWSRLAAVAVIIVASSGCVSASRGLLGSEPPWDLDRAETLVWKASDPAFEQDHALEASGLTASERFLYVPSEKYACLLQLDLRSLSAARVIPVAVPRHAELEGIAWHDSTLYLCDEAHAAVYSIVVEDEDALTDLSQNEPLPAVRMPLPGLSVEGGKIGFEGIALDPAGTELFLLLERSGSEETSCVSTIFRLRLADDRLMIGRDSIDIELNDCSWRLTGLAALEGKLLALKTQFPGERYEIIAIDPDTGRWRVVVNLTGVLRGVRASGWANNVEGLTVTADGTLWLTADNAVTDVVDHQQPPVAAERTLFLRIPPTEAAKVRRGRLAAR